MSVVQRLAPGSDDQTSAAIVIAAGSSMLFGMFVASGSLHARSRLHLLQDSPGAPVSIRTLTALQGESVATIDGPATVYIKRPEQSANGVDIGGFTDDGTGSP